MSHIVPVAVGDTVRLRKPHPCGGRDWQVTRIGADIGLKCLTCGHVVLLDRETFERRVVVAPVTPASADAPNKSQGKQ